jgi:hypothetical protein
MLNRFIEKTVRIWNRSSFAAMCSIASHADMDLQHNEKIVFYVAFFFTSTHELPLSLSLLSTWKHYFNSHEPNQLCDALLLSDLLVRCSTMCETGSQAKRNRFHTT